MPPYGDGLAYQRSYSTSGLVNTGTGDCLRAGKPPWYVNSHPGQLSLLPSSRLEINTSKCGDALWPGVKAGSLWLIQFVYARVVVGETMIRRYKNDLLYFMSCFVNYIFSDKRRAYHGSSK